MSTKPCVMLAAQTDDSVWQLLDATGQPDLGHSAEARKLADHVESFHGTPSADDHGRLLAQFANCEDAVHCAISLLGLQVAPAVGSGPSVGIAAADPADDDGKAATAAALSLAVRARAGEIFLSNNARALLPPDLAANFMGVGDIRLLDFTGSIEAVKWIAPDTKVRPSVLPSKDLPVIPAARRILPLFASAVAACAAATAIIVVTLRLLDVPPLAAKAQPIEVAVPAAETVPLPVAHAPGQTMRIAELLPRYVATVTAYESVLAAMQSAAATKERDAAAAAPELTGAPVEKAPAETKPQPAEPVEPVRVGAEGGRPRSDKPPTKVARAKRLATYHAPIAVRREPLQSKRMRPDAALGDVKLPRDIRRAIKAAEALLAD